MWARMRTRHGGAWQADIDRAGEEVTRGNIEAAPTETAASRERVWWAGEDNVQVVAECTRADRDAAARANAVSIDDDDDPGYHSTIPNAEPPSPSVPPPPLPPPLTDTAASGAREPIWWAGEDNVQVVAERTGAERDAAARANAVSIDDNDDPGSQSQIIPKAEPPSPSAESKNLAAERTWLVVLGNDCYICFDCGRHYHQLGGPCCTDWRCIVQKLRAPRARAGAHPCTSCGYPCWPRPNSVLVAPGKGRLTLEVNTRNEWRRLLMGRTSEGEGGAKGGGAQGGGGRGERGGGERGGGGFPAGRIQRRERRKREGEGEGVSLLVRCRA